MIKARRFDFLNSTVINNSPRFNDGFLIKIGVRISISYQTHFLIKEDDSNSSNFSQMVLVLNSMTVFGSAQLL